MPVHELRHTGVFNSASGCKDLAVYSIINACMPAHVLTGCIPNLKCAYCSLSRSESSLELREYACLYSSKAHKHTVSQRSPDAFQSLMLACTRYCMIKKVDAPAI
jgi:hypothetical protein